MAEVWVLTPKLLKAPYTWWVTPNDPPGYTTWYRWQRASDSAINEGNWPLDPDGIKGLIARHGKGYHFQQVMRVGSFDPYRPAPAVDEGQ